MFALGVKFLLFVLLTTRFSVSAGAEASVFVPLAAVAVSLLLTLTRGRLPAPARLAEGLLVTGFCFAFPDLIAFLPLFIFDFLPEHLERRPDEALPFWETAGNLAGLPLLLPLAWRFDFVTFLYLLIALALSYSSSEMTRQKQQVHQTRDRLEEQLLRLDNRLREMKNEDEKNRHFARLDERSRISRQLHDVTGHTLSSALLQVGALEVLNHDPKLKEPLGKLHETLDWGMTGIREALHDLYADSFDLKAELQACLDRAEGFEGRLECPDTSGLPLQLKLDILSVAREAVTNAAKYSNGSRISIRLSLQDSLTALNITDNGRSAAGLKPENLESGIGFRGMREIVDRYNGILNINPSPENGFTVHAVFFRAPAPGRGEARTKTR